MSQKQLNRFKIISIVIEGNLKIADAAKSLCLSERQIKRLKKEVMEQGSGFLIHKNSGKIPSHAIDNNLKQRIVNLKNTDNYKGANFLHFKELLKSHEGITISYSALHSLLTKSGINSPKKRRKPKQHHRRKRVHKEAIGVRLEHIKYDIISLLIYLQALVKLKKR